jgi:hypothetical protein
VTSNAVNTVGSHDILIAVPAHGHRALVVVAGQWYAFVDTADAKHLAACVTMEFGGKGLEWCGTRTLLRTVQRLPVQAHRLQGHHQIRHSTRRVLL